MMAPIPPRRRRRRRTPPALIALVAAVALHGVGFVLLLALGNVQWQAGRLPSPPPVLEGVTVRELSGEQWQQNRAQPPNAEETARAEAQSPKPQPVKPPPQRRKPEPVPKGQVVATAPGNGEEDPEAKYLAESSNKVSRETRAKDQSPVYRNPAAQSTSPNAQQEGGRDAVEEAQTEGNGGVLDDDRPLSAESERKLAMEIPDVQARDEVALQTPAQDGAGPQVTNRKESIEVDGNSDRLRLQAGAPGDEGEASQGKKGAPGLATLTPSLSVLDNVYGAAPNDHLDDVAEGQGTYLNTREWRYSSFFNRVKQSIGMTWNPARQLQMRDPTGHTYSGRDRHTLVKVTLTKDGRIKDLYVLKSCGLDFLDLEAVRSFERAQPFPNPPEGLLDGESTVTFNFGFFVELGGGPRMHMFR